MSKIICDICGTSYPETADQCPICGCAKDVTAQSLVDDMLEEEVVETAPARKGGRFAASPAANRKKTPAPAKKEEEYDDDDEDEDDEDDEYEDDYDDDETEHKSNAPLVVLLVIVVAALIAVTGFILVRYYMPYILADETTVPTTETQEATDPQTTTEATIPCSNLALTSGGEVTLEAEGDHWLINVMALPENTTDKLVYTSSDETVAIVNEQGKVTAVGEGTAVITIQCGQQQLTCTVTCDFTPEETTAPTEEPTEPEVTTEPTEPLKDIDLEKAISYTELTFNGPNQGYTFKINGLKNTEVKWSSEDESIVTVDENGRVLNQGKGVTYIICQYGDQIVKIKIISQW